METAHKLPYYAKVTIILIGMFVFISMLSILQEILLPFIYATISAILLSPVVNFLVRKKINQTVAISAVMLIAILVIIEVIILVSSQAGRLNAAWPQLTERLHDVLTRSVTWASGYFDISAVNINRWIDNAKEEINNNKGTVIGTTLTTVGGLLAGVVLTPVYIFMILLYRNHLISFIHKIFDGQNENQVSEILTATKKIIQSYLVGLFVEFAIVAALNSIGLLILGIDYALLLGVLVALLNVIPYIGGIIGVGIFMAIALLTKSPEYVLYVFGLYTVIQLIDNNYLVPQIVGSKVKLNALISLVVVIAGAALWGIPGMFLSIPLTAILKVVFDHVEALKPWGYLLGHMVHTSGKNALLKSKK